MVMLSSSSPEYAELNRPEHIEAILPHCGRNYDYVYSRHGGVAGDCAVSALETADSIFLVVNEDIAALHDAKRCVKVQRRLTFRTRSGIVVNKDGISKIKTKDVANLLESAPVLVVPYDLKAAMMAVNRGIPKLHCASAPRRPRRYATIRWSASSERAVREAQHETAAPRPTQSRIQVLRRTVSAADCNFRRK